MQREGTRLVFGPRKYGAYALLVARWLGKRAEQGKQYRYVTIGGTELFDAASLHWIDAEMIDRFVSFELREDRLRLAQAQATTYRARGLDVEVIQGDFFSYERDTDQSHIFFADLEGIVGMQQYCAPFERWLTDGVIRSGDFALVTSHLAHRPGWERTLDQFDAEFRLLGIRELNVMKVAFDVLHPAFVLHRALVRVGIQDDIGMECLGHVRYTDTATMGIYAFSWFDGRTRLEELVGSVATMNANSREWGVFRYADAGQGSGGSAPGG